MGRLFWKFFLFTLLAQVIATVGVGATFWLNGRGQQSATSSLNTSPPAAMAIDSAAATLRHGGLDSLRGLLREIGDCHPVYAVGADGQDVLGRAVDAAALQQARGILAQRQAAGADATRVEAGQRDAERRDAGRRGGGRRQVVREVAAGDGRVYLLFSPASGAARPLSQATLFAPAMKAGATPEPGQRTPPLFPRFRPLMTAVTAVLASLIFAAMLAGYFSRPIRNLRRAFESAAKGNFNEPLGPAMGARRDELTDLGHDFDRMASQLRNLMDGQRKLLHDVSHELRSPLARMQAAIGLARQDPAKMESSMERIERESTRMDMLVGELLTLSRLEAGVMPPRDDDIAMNELLAEIVDDAAFEAQSYRRGIVFEGSCTVKMRGSAELLRRAIENVVRNAIKHTAEGTTVQVQCALAEPEGMLLIHVLDHGPGIPKHELEAIWEPFYRGSGGRNHTDGHGLGLALTRRIIEAQGGRVAAANQPGGGLCVELAMPFEGATQQGGHA